VYPESHMVRIVQSLQQVETWCSPIGRNVISDVVPTRICHACAITFWALGWTQFCRDAPGFTVFNFRLLGRSWPMLSSLCYRDAESHLIPRNPHPSPRYPQTPRLASENSASSGVLHEMYEMAFPHGQVGLAESAKFWYLVFM
jgi:hypothetical protein